MADEFSRSAWRCHTCGDELDHGSRIVVLEDSVVGNDEFIPKADREGLLVFCSDDHFLDYKIFDDMHSYRGSQIPAADTEGGLEPFLSCERCGASLDYGMRALRIHDRTIVELESSRPITRAESSIFCSKYCAENSTLWFRSKSIADIWEEVQRRVDGDSGDSI